MQVVIALFDRFTALDAVGPYQVLLCLPGSEVIFASERAGDVTDESGILTLRAQASYADVPRPDIMVVPSACPMRATTEHAARRGRPVLPDRQR